MEEKYTLDLSLQVMMASLQVDLETNVYSFIFIKYQHALNLFVGDVDINKTR